MADITQDNADLEGMSYEQLQALLQKEQAADGVSNAILGQESGNNPNIHASIDGAIGMGQIMPATFKMYAQPGEDINNPADNLAVHKRIIEDLSKKAGGDPARIAVGYFSGPGNIAPLDHETPYLHDRKDGNGKTVSGYVSDVLGRLNPISSAQASEAPVTEQPVPQEPSAIPAEATDDFDGMSYEQLQALLAKEGGNTEATPSSTVPSMKNFASELRGLPKNIAEDFAKRKQNVQDFTRWTPSGNITPTSAVYQGGQAFGLMNDVLGRGMSAITPEPVSQGLHRVGHSISDSAIGDRFKQGLSNIGGLYSQYEQAHPETSRVLSSGASAANALGFLPAGEALGAGLKGVGKVSDYLGTASTSGPFASASKAAASKLAPKVAPQTAKLVRDAEALGINIPAKTFSPGLTSKTLDKVGVLPGQDTKAQITHALSKEMGHTGTNHLDVATMEDIQDNIGGRMNDFALKADNAGGIPIDDSALEAIGKASYATKGRLKTLMEQVKGRVKNGVISGADYQALTQKGGELDRAMGSGIKSVQNTAKEIREYLDNSLQKTVHPDDLADFQKARKQYRTLKIVEPLVESGGVAGQADSGTRLYNAVKKNYGSMKNALKYHPNLGKIAQIANEYPELLRDVETSRVGKALKIASTPAALGVTAGVTAMGGVPAGLAAGAVIPAAVGTGKYLSSPFFKESILKNSGFKQGGYINPLRE